MSEFPYDVVIGLEVHVQLLTQTKLFCRCSTRFGADPNTQTCPVCTGMPGSLPVMNRQAFQLALKTAVALNCEIPEFTKWDRKNYYYPDLPKGYQISQYDLPLARDGFLEISDPRGSFAAKRIGIIRAHLEEDAGKSMHDEAAGKADSRIDLNRTGTPLLEIVSCPDLRSPLEARAYLSELKLLLTYLHVSDCNMQEGSLRVDANVNLHIHSPQGRIETPIVEVKNMNSFRAVERALAFEAPRQYEVWRETGQRKGASPKQTRGWDDQAEVTRPQREKEESSDYRYFPDPDLVPVIVTREEIARLREQLGELPSRIRQRLQRDYALDAYDAEVLVNQGPEVVAYFAQLAELSGDGKRAANWVQQDILRTLHDRGLAIKDYPVSAQELAGLLRRIPAGELDTTRAREVLQQMLDTGKSAEQAIAALGITQVDQNTLVELCRTLLAENPKVAADLKSGKQQAIGSLIGRAKKLNPNVNPAQVRDLLLRLIAES